jgi:predicted ATP-grasp superfamily ATP-dependent carboligase
VSAIVCNCAYNGLSIVRELGRKGVDVHAVDSFRNVGTVSRYATYHNCPNPTVAEREFVDFMLQLGASRDDRPVIFPTNDHWAAVLARHRDRLADYYRPCVASEAVVDRLLDKERFYEWAGERDYPVPGTWRPGELDAVTEEAFPVAAKLADARYQPEMLFRSSVAMAYNRLLGNDAATDEEISRRRERAETAAENRLVILEDRSELEAFVDEHAADIDDYLFQEYVRGRSDAMYIVGVYADRDHEVRGLFTGRKLRGYPPDIGDCKLGQSEPLPDRLTDLAAEMVSDLGFHGIAEFEFKRDTDTGRYRLIEINPRSWSWVGITAACGASLPWIAYLDLTSDVDVGTHESRADAGETMWVKMTEDLPNCLYFNGRAGYPEWDLSLRKWWQSIRADRTVTAEFSARDPVPGVYATFLAGVRVAKTLLG